MDAMWPIRKHRVGYSPLMVVLKLALLSIFPKVYHPIIYYVFTRDLGWDFEGKNQYN